MLCKGVEVDVSSVVKFI